MMKRVVLALIIVLGVLLSIVLVRTVLHTPEQVNSPGQVSHDVDKSQIAQHLSEAIQFQTISHQNPELRNQQAFDDFINWVEASYPKVHAILSRDRYADSLLFHWKGADAKLKPILLTAHYDVVPVIPGTESLWKHAPFAGEIVNGRIWGRGALDDKSAVIAMLEAVEYLIGQGFQPTRSLYLSFGHDEEIGGAQGAAKVVAALKKAGVQLAWSLDEGSFVLDGFIPGIDVPMASINVAEKGSLNLQIVAKAEGGHSSAPPRQTAVGLLAEAITKLEQRPVPGGLEGLSLKMFDTISRYMPFIPKVFFANQWMFNGILDDQLSSENLTNAMLRTTTAPTMLSASIKSNVLPIEAIALVNFRIHPRDSVESVLNYVRGIVETEHVEVRYREGSGRPASEVSSWDAEGFRVVKKAIEETFGGAVVTPGLMIAGSDSKHYGKVADNAYRFNPFLVGKADFAGFHGTNEQIGVENLARGVVAYIQIIKHGAGDSFR